MKKYLVIIKQDADSRNQLGDFSQRLYKSFHVLGEDDPNLYVIEAPVSADEIADTLAPNGGHLTDSVLILEICRNSKYVVTSTEIARAIDAVKFLES